MIRVGLEVNGYRMAATSVENEAYWLGGSNNTYNYNGIAYDGSGGVPTSNQDIIYVEDLAFASRTYDFEIPIL